MNKIISNRQIAKDIYEMKLEADTSKIKAPDQFINVKIEGFYLRRPISICDWDGKSITIIYKVVGAGTKALSKMAVGQELDILYPLGNGFTLRETGKILVVGGGAGVPPMYGLAKRLMENGIRPTVVLGFNSKEDVFYEEAFRKLGVEVKVTTLDGTYGIKGFVTDAMEPCDYAYVCGPEPMEKAVYDLVPDGQFSFEARMACGFGGCMGCSCETKYGAKRICKEGPVLEREEIIW